MLACWSNDLLVQSPLFQPTLDRRPLPLCKYGWPDLSHANTHHHNRFERTHSHAHAHFVSMQPAEDAASFDVIVLGAG